MSLWAIVPVKPLRRGKSRLASVLNEEQRIALNRQLLVHTVQTLQKVKPLEHVLVVSRDPEALALARDYGARTLLEDGHPELNIALSRASILARAYNIHGILVVPADLPFMEPEDIERLINLSTGNKSVVIAPDRKKDGTNALLLIPPDAIEFSYGPGSFHRHSQNTRQAGIPLTICELPGLELDVDFPEDLVFIDEQLVFEKNGSHVLKGETTSEEEVLG